jgi:hypothetical protein
VLIDTLEVALSASDTFRYLLAVASFDDNDAVETSTVHVENLDLTAIKNRLVVSAVAYDPTGGIAMGGSATVESASWTGSASGGIVLGGSTGFVYVIVPDTTSITLGGSGTTVASGFPFSGTASGGIVMGGIAQYFNNAFLAAASGGIELSGEAKVISTNFSYQGVGGILMGGGIIGPNLYYTPTGGIVIAGGTGGMPRIHTPIGGIVIGGSADVVSEHFSFAVTGGIVLGGEMGGSWSGPVFNYANGGLAEVLNFEVQFPDIESGTLESSEDTVQVDCGCGELPLVLNFSHNLAINNVLSDFLDRNGLALDTELTLQYQGSSWIKHFHYTGFGAQSSSEQWSIVFEWGCVDTVGGEEQGVDRWQFSMLVRRSDLIRDLDYSTRYLVTIPASQVLSPCVDGNMLSIAITLDTSTGIVTIPDGFVDITRLSDSVGLFKNKYWTLNPNFVVNIKQTAIDEAVPTYDIKPIFPTSPQDELIEDATTEIGTGVTAVTIGS